jgi:hypothetical protein
MRRWLAIFLLVFMPLQQAWAAVSAYCQHESDAAANHLGHHEHHHQGASGDESETDSASIGFHADCGVCHAASVAALPSSVKLALPSIDALVLSGASSLLLLERPSEPERPNWARPA